MPHVIVVGSINRDIVARVPHIPAPGETVLGHGSAQHPGGKGANQAVAAARLLSAGRVIAAGRNRAVLDALGADDIVDLTLGEAQLRQRFAEVAQGGLDVIVDYVWGTPVEVLICVLAKADLAAKDGGASIRLVSVGEMAGPTIALPSTYCADHGCRSLAAAQQISRRFKVCAASLPKSSTFAARAVSP